MWSDGRGRPQAGADGRQGLCEASPGAAGGSGRRRSFGCACRLQVREEKEESEGEKERGEMRKGQAKRTEKKKEKE